MNIRLFKPSLGKEELEEIKSSFDESWIGLGPKVSQFEREWSKFIGCKESIAVNSATAALHLALRCFDFPQGSKVLVPMNTFSATASAVLYNNLVPVFVDSNKETLGIDLDDLKKKYDEDCVAVMPVHYTGHPVAMDLLVPWARSKNLAIIEDCAHTVKGMYKGKYLGTWGDIGCFSFEEKKCMTTGDGGMLCSNNSELVRDVKAYRWVGIDKDNWKTAKEYTKKNKDALHWFYELRVLGYKYNMNDLAASIGLVQLNKVEEMNSKRSKLIAEYMDGLEKLNIEPLLPFKPKKFVYQMFGIRHTSRDDLIVFLKSKGIATGCHYTPLHMQPLFKQFQGDCPNAEKIYPSMITLPLHVGLSSKDISYILSCLNEFSN